MLCWGNSHSQSSSKPMTELWPQPVRPTRGGPVGQWVSKVYWRILYPITKFRDVLGLGKVCTRELKKNIENVHIRSVSGTDFSGSPQGDMDRGCWDLFQILQPRFVELIPWEISEIRNRLEGIRDFRRLGIHIALSPWEIMVLEDPGS